MGTQAPSKDSSGAKVIHCYRLGDKTIDFSILQVTFLSTFCIRSRKFGTLEGY